MKRLFLLTVLLAFITLSVSAQTKKDGTPDMRYKANKEIYGSGYSAPSYSAPNYSTPTYSTPVYSQPKQERNYDNGGQLKLQNGYLKSNGTYVEPHIKTKPDNQKWNNKSSWDN